MRKIQQYALYLAILLFPFQDTVLGKSSLGFIGANISSLPLMLYALIDFYIWLYSRKMAISRSGIMWFYYTIILSVIYLAAWGTISHGINVIYKVFSMSIVFSLWVYTIFCIDYTPTLGLKRSTYLAFLLLIIGVVLCDLHLPGLGTFGTHSLIHATRPEGSGRWRSFSMEPSTFSATVVSLGAASAYLSNRRKSRILSIILTFILLIASGSKGGLLVLGLSGFFILFLKKPSPLRAIAYLLVCIGLAALTGILVWQQLNTVDMYRATGTFATRLSLAVWTAIVLAHHPWGVGLSGFYEAMTIYLPQSMDWLQRISPVPLNFSEVQEYVYGTDVPLDTKCFLLEYLVSFGIPFLIAYLMFAKKILQTLLERKQNILLVASVFLLIGFSTYVNGLALYAAFYVMGLSYHEYRLLQTQKHAIEVRNQKTYNGNQLLINN